ncbi:MAG: hypothetical protein KAV87_68195 [Desulfobacteraceae bacterium]|nr:hypothetical protein [Desulfobacteraceae bacterium]
MATTSTSARRNVLSSSAIKVPCRVATTANITLEAEQTIDGVACVEGDRILVKEQTTVSENGIYDVSSGTWVRSPDWDGASDAKEGTYLYVTQGSTNIGFWIQSLAGDITIGTSEVTFATTDVDSTLGTNLASIANGKGASLIGIEDSAGLYTAATVEAALASLLGGEPGVVYRTLMLLKNYSEVVQAHTSVSGAESINLQNGNIHTLDLTGAVTLTFTNPVATGKCSTLIIEATQDGTGTWAITWPGSVKWPGGSPPTVTVTAGVVTTWVLYTLDGGTTWRGSLMGDNFS